MKQSTSKMRSSSLCARCHELEQQEYAELYLPLLESCETPKECADCHMPARVERLTEGHILSLIHPRRVVRDHSFPVWTDEVAGAAVEVREMKLTHEGENQYLAVATLTNRGAAHRIPTGGYGYREVLILVELLDDTGAVIGRCERSLFAERSDGLKPLKPTRFQFSASIPSGAKPARFRLHVERVNKDRSFRFVLAHHERIFKEAESRPYQK